MTETIQISSSSSLLHKRPFSEHVISNTEITRDNILPENSQFKLKPETTLRDDQLADINKMLNGYYQLICNEMGMGKTIVTLISAINIYERQEDEKHPVLIVTSNTIQINWSKEISKHFDYPPSSVLFLTSENVGTFNNFDNYVLVMITYDALVKIVLCYQWSIYRKDNGDQDDVYNMKTNILKIGSKHPVRQYSESYKTIRNYNFVKYRWSALIVDEAQKYQNNNTLWYVTSNTLISDRRYMLTATPLTNTLTNLKNLLKWLRIENNDYDYICNHKMICTTRKDTPELKEVHDALRMDICVYVQSTFKHPKEISDYKKIEEEFIRDIDIWKSMDTNDEKYRKMYAIILTHIIAMREASISYHLSYGAENAAEMLKKIEEYPTYMTYESTKMQMALEKYEEYRNGVVFCSEWTSALNILDYTLRKRGHKTTIPKSGDPKGNIELINQWNKDNSSALLINIQSLAEGYDLPSARYMIALNPTFLSTKLQQFFGRSMRASRVTDPVTGKIVENKCIGIMLLVGSTFETDYVFTRCIAKISDNTAILKRVIKAQKTNNQSSGLLGREALITYSEYIKNKQYKNPGFQMSIDETHLDDQQVRKVLYDVLYDIILFNVEERSLFNNNRRLQLEKLISEKIKPLDQLSDRELMIFSVIYEILTNDSPVTFHGPMTIDPCHQIVVDRNNGNEIIICEHKKYGQNNIVSITRTFLRDNEIAELDVIQPVILFPCIKQVQVITGKIDNPSDFKYIDFNELEISIRQYGLSDLIQSSAFYGIKEEPGLKTNVLTSLFKTQINNDLIRDHCKKLTDEFKYDEFKLTMHDGQRITKIPLSIDNMLKSLKLDLSNQLYMNKMADSLLNIDSIEYDKLVDRLNQIVLLKMANMFIPYNSNIKITYNDSRIIDIDSFRK